MTAPTLDELARAAFAEHIEASSGFAPLMPQSWDSQPEDVRDGMRRVAGRVAAMVAGPAEPMHLMTIQMGAWCGATGPGNGRASSQWREVTCTECTAKGMTELRSLAWDMLATMGPSRAALAFALRAGRLGVTDENGRPLAAACAHDEDPWLDAKLAGAE